MLNFLLTQLIIFGVAGIFKFIFSFYFIVFLILTVLFPWSFKPEKWEGSVGMQGRLAEAKMKITMLVA